MELLSFDLPRKQSDHKPVVICPLGDIQYSGERGLTAKDLLRRHLDRAMELGGWFVGLGDYTDFASPSNRQRLRSAALYDTAEDVIEDKALDLTLELFDRYLKPTKGRWLGMTHGHHWASLRSGETTDQRLCQMLNTTFLGTCAYIRLQFNVESTRAPVTLWVHHGCGGGQKAGSPLGKIEDMAASFPSADIYIMGHTTKESTAPIERVTAFWNARGGPKLVSRRAYLVNSGGFARSYPLGWKQGRVPMGPYTEHGMMKPAALGAPVIRITPRMDCRRRPDGKQQSVWVPEVSVEI